MTGDDDDELDAMTDFAPTATAPTAAVPARPTTTSPGTDELRTPARPKATGPGRASGDPEVSRPARADAVWIPGPTGPLAGWFHQPGDGQASGAILLCPPLGMEHIVSYRLLRRLASQLATDGMAVLRFDYPGTGDSTDGPRDEGTVATWQASVHAAVDWLAARRAPRLALVGMRVGAVMAALEAVERTDVDALVLWDPCTTGRQYVREQRALRMVNLPNHATRGDGGVETPGFWYGPRTVAELGALDARPAQDRFPKQTLLLVRSTDDLEQFSGGTDPHYEWQLAEDQGRLLDYSSVLSIEPRATVASLQAWLATALSGAREPLQQPAMATTAVVAGAADHSPVIEEPVTLGPAELFAVRTSSPTNSRDDLPTVVFLNVAEEPHIGPGRLWVELARDLATHGFDVVRLDFNGVGDSPARPGRLQFPDATRPILDVESVTPTDEYDMASRFPNPSYDQGNLDDLVDVVAAIRRPVILAGLCSGAYHAVEMGTALGVAGVCAINPVFEFTPPEVCVGLPLDPRRRAAFPRKQWANSAKNLRLGARVRGMLPDAAWQLIDLLHLQPSPVGGLRLLGEGDTVSLVVCSTHDATPFLERGARVLRRLMASDRFTFTVIPELDHALFVWSQRERVSSMLKDHLINAFVGDDAPRARSEGTVHP